MQKTIKELIECPKCYGTGVYQGCGESNDVAVVCQKCKGTGEYKYEYTFKPFRGRVPTGNVKRVYQSGYGYKIGLGEIHFKDLNIKIDMSKEGVSYQEFIEGKQPKHIESLACPMQADQGACHAIKGFSEECGCGWGAISQCINQPQKHKCWTKFNLHKTVEEK